MKPIMLILVVSSMLLMVNTPTTHAYTTCDGIEQGDEAFIDYIGTLQDGTEFDSGNNVKFTIDPNRLITGFYEGMLGMKIGEEKTIIVRPSEGYQDPSHELYGETLIFEVYVERINGEIITCEGDSGGSSFGSGLLRGLGIIAGTGILGFIGISLYMNLQSTTATKCEHCAANNKKTAAAGTCAKCGNAYCRDSFGRGCPNCKSNTFVPYDKELKA